MVRILIFFLGNMPQFVVIRSNSLMVFQFQRNTKRSCSVQICHCSLHTNVILKQHELLVSMHHKDDKNLSILTLFIYIYMQNPTVIIQHTTGSTSLHHLPFPSLHFRSQGDGGQDGLHLETPRRSETGVT